MGRQLAFSSRFSLALALVAGVTASGCGKAAPTGLARLTATPVVAAAPALPRVKLPVPMPVLTLSQAPIDEVQALVADGLLPPGYPALAALMDAEGPDAAIAAARAGQSGPFSDDFGDPRHMLAAARFARQTPYYAKFLKAVKRGDLVFIASNRPDGFVQKLSGGPFDHVMICVDPAPPGRYVEAVGVTGVAGDPSGDRVRRTTGSRYADAGFTLRIQRPAAGRAGMADEAIAYAEAQLGKPYNYTFSDDLAGESAFYCSSLVYKAYRKAGFVWKLDKDPGRDRLAAALIETVLVLEPREPVVVADELMRLLHASEKLDNRVFARFVVRRLLPNCKKTEALATTIAEREALEDAIVRVMEGHAFKRFDDVLAFLRDSRVDTAATLQALKLMGTAALPYADILAAYFAGPDSRGARQADQILGLLPGVRAPWRTLPDLESPTDLAWADLPHEDFNALKATPIEAPWPFALAAKAPGR